MDQPIGQWVLVLPDPCPIERTYWTWKANFTWSVSDWTRLLDMESEFYLVRVRLNAPIGH